VETVNRYDKSRDTGAVQALADRMFEALAQHFPVCSASDEFHYFPQAQPAEHDWSRWDDFSPDAVEAMASKLSAWEKDLSNLGKNKLDRDTRVDASLLCQVARTLREQLTEVRFQQIQPTFYLTIAGIGLAETMDQDPLAWKGRVKSLPAFLDRARIQLRQIPSLFRDLGLEMIGPIRSWLAPLSPIRPGVQPVLEALDRFEGHLRQASPRDTFLLAPELLERIVRDHTGCGMGTEETRKALDEEIREMKQIMDEEAGRLFPDGSWQEAFEAIPLPHLPDDGLVGLYREAVSALGRHCLEQDLVAPDLFRSCPVRVEPVPSYLTTIRSAAAYSIPPGHPPRGGTFFIIDAASPESVPRALYRDYRMLAAHETYPGHHLLDVSRWGLERALRRPIEFPIFYEGWACFAEELLTYTGYFQGPADRLLLARRHFWRAIRGKVDLDIQAGTKDLAAAARCLAQAGMSQDRAASVVRQYALKPGYQLCYTMGVRRFRDLYERFTEDGPRDFARQVLAEGEIGFDHLKSVLVC
jgi:uncharacterized protein (DUF885 family)